MDQMALTDDVLALHAWRMPDMVVYQHADAEWWLPPLDDAIPLVRVNHAGASLLSAMDGFISVERFQSLTDPAKLLSLSFWRDEAAVAGWRNHERHRATQAAGRAGIFANYRLRVAAVLRDYGLRDRAQAPADSQTRHPS